MEQNEPIEICFRSNPEDAEKAYVMLNGKNIKLSGYIRMIASGILAAVFLYTAIRKGEGIYFVYMACAILCFVLEIVFSQKYRKAKIDENIHSSLTTVTLADDSISFFADGKLETFKKKNIKKKIEADGITALCFTEKSGYRYYKNT